MSAKAYCMTFNSLPTWNRLLIIFNWLGLFSLCYDSLLFDNIDTHLRFDIVFVNHVNHGDYCFGTTVPTLFSTFRHVSALQ